MLKQKRKALFAIDIILQLFLTVGVDHKVREEGTYYTQLTVRFDTYNEICRYQKASHSAPLFIP